MFRFLTKYALPQNRGLLSNPNNGGHHYPTPIFSLLGFLINSTTRSFSSDITSTITPKDSFTISYLINSCGLPKEKAISASKRFQLKTSSQPDSVLVLLRNYGFSNTHISFFVFKCPFLLLANPEKILKPKLEFFRSIGFSDSDLAKLLSNNPTILQLSLENQLIPKFDFLKTIIHTDTNVIKASKRSTWLIAEDLQKHIAPKIAVLQSHGVSNSSISTLLTAHPRSFLHSDDRFNEAVKNVKDMGFDCSKHLFMSAIRVLVSLRKSTWEAKIDVFKRWGWSDEEILTAFKKEPLCMMTSEKKIMRVMAFLVNKLGYDPSVIAKYPVALTYSLEKTVIPRCSVIQVLISNALVKKDCSLNTVLTKSENYFLKNFVTRFDGKVHGLLNVYQGKVSHLELPITYD